MALDPRRCFTWNKPNLQQPACVGRVIGGPLCSPRPLSGGAASVFVRDHCWPYGPAALSTQSMGRGPSSVTCGGPVLLTPETPAFPASVA